MALLGKKTPVSTPSPTTRGGLDDGWKIFRETVLRTSFEVQGKAFCLCDLERIVGRAAVDAGAGGGLLALLVRSLPGFYRELRDAILQEAKAAISSPVEPQYRIRTEGKSETVHSVDDCLREKGKRREDYLCWLDLDEEVHRSIVNPDARIGQKAIRLLVYLVERLGRRVPFEEVLRNVWEEEGSDNVDIRKHQENMVNQQIVKLHKFCLGRFREHLFPDKFEKGLGLKRTFSDKYFIFECLK